MALQGTEVLFVNGVQANGQLGATLEQTTTGAIAALAATEGAPFTVTNVTTVGNGTLTAAGLVGGAIVRTGPVAAFSDATDSAVNIIAALPGVVVGSSFNILVKNATAFTQTITAGAGVTLPLTVIVPAFTIANYIGTVSTATTVTLVHIDTVPIAVGTTATVPAITTISTVGAGTLTAAAFVTGLINRAGSQSGTPFTDTTDTAAAIIAACGQLVNKIGTAMYVEVANSTNAIQTITGGTGVTVSGVSVIPQNTISQFLVTYTAAATLTMVGLGVTQNVASAINMLGSSSGQTTLQPSAVASGVLTLPAVTDTVAVLGTAQTFTAVQTFTNSDLALLGSSTGKTTFASANAGASNFTVTVPAATGTTALLGAPIAVGSSLAITAAMSNQAIKLDTAAGSTATLPAATGSGAVYRFVVTTTATSNAHKILAASSSDFLIGNAVGHTAAGATLAFSAAAATAHSIQMPFAGTQPSGGFIGDYFEFCDTAANLWTVRGTYQAGTTATTPFSAATS